MLGARPAAPERRSATTRSRAWCSTRSTCENELEPGDARAAARRGRGGRRARDDLDWTREYFVPWVGAAPPPRVLRRHDPAEAARLRAPGARRLSASGMREPPPHRGRRARAVEHERHRDRAGRRSRRSTVPTRSFFRPPRMSTTCVVRDTSLLAPRRAPSHLRRRRPSRCRPTRSCSREGLAPSSRADLVEAPPCTLVSRRRHVASSRGCVCRPSITPTSSTGCRTDRAPSR